jgi:hypothetical protein
MTMGIKLPIKIAPSGGVSLVDSDDNDFKIISLALGSDDNENAFNQDIGLGIDLVYSVRSPHIRGKIIGGLRKIYIRGKIIGGLRKIFAKFEAQKRYKLIPSTIKWIEGPEDGELTLEIKYLNLESDEIKTFSRTISANDQEH